MTVWSFRVVSMVKEGADPGQRGRVLLLSERQRGVGGEAGCVSAQSVTRVAVQSMCFHTATWSSAKPLIRSVMLQNTYHNGHKMTQSKTKRNKLPILRWSTCCEFPALYRPFIYQTKKKRNSDDNNSRIKTSFPKKNFYTMICWPHVWCPLTSSVWGWNWTDSLSTADIFAKLNHFRCSGRNGDTPNSEQTVISLKESCVS